MYVCMYVRMCIVVREEGGMVRYVCICIVVHEEGGIVQVCMYVHCCT